jgi:AcrR family transcriptional regulator
MLAMSTSKRDGYHHGDLRAALLRAAADMLREGGPAAITLREAARRAGVSPTAPYRHFAEKEALLAALATDGFRDLGKALAAATSEKSAGLNRAGEAYVRFALANPARFRLMFGHGVSSMPEHPELMAAALQTFEALTGMVARNGGDKLAAIKAWSQVHGLADLLIERMIPGEEPEALIAALFP